jgi:uncharacterized protein DUF3489
MANWSQNFTVKSNARRGARKVGVDPSKVQPFVKAGKTLYRFPMAATEAPKTAKPAKAKTPKAAKAKPAKSRKKLTHTQKANLKDLIDSVQPPKARQGSNGSKFETVAAMLRQPGGASMTAIVEATGWKSHTARARISVDVSKLLNKGEEITRRREGGVSHYSIVKSKQLDLPIGEAA